MYNSKYGRIYLLSRGRYGQYVGKRGIAPEKGGKCRAPGRKVLPKAYIRKTLRQNGRSKEEKTGLRPGAARKRAEKREGGGREKAECEENKADTAWKNDVRKAAGKGQTL